MTIQVNNKSFFTNPLVTRTVKEVLKDPTAPILWKGSHWKIGDKEVTKDKKFNPFKFFINKTSHRFKYRYSKKYKARFKQAIESLNTAIKSDDLMQKMQKVADLKKELNKLAKEEFKLAAIALNQSEKVAIFEEAYRREELSLAEFVNEKQTHKRLCCLLQKFKTKKVELDEHLKISGQFFEGLRANFWNAIGMPTEEVGALQKNLADIQKEIDLLSLGYPNLSALQVSDIEIGVRNEQSIIDAVKDKISQHKDSELLDRMRAEIEGLKRSELKAKEQLDAVRKQKANIEMQLKSLE